MKTELFKKDVTASKNEIIAGLKADIVILKSQIQNRRAIEDATQFKESVVMPTNEIKIKLSDIITNYVQYQSYKSSDCMNDIIELFKDQVKPIDLREELLKFAKWKDKQDFPQPLLPAINEYLNQESDKL